MEYAEDCMIEENTSFKGQLSSENTLSGPKEMFTSNQQTQSQSLKGSFKRLSKLSKTSMLDTTQTSNASNGFEEGDSSQSLIFYQKESESKKGRKKSGKVNEEKEVKKRGAYKKKPRKNARGRGKEMNENELDIDLTQEASYIPVDSSNSISFDLVIEKKNPEEVNNNSQKELIISTIKKKKGRGKNQETDILREVNQRIENNADPKHLINPIPDFSDKFNTENIYIINKQFYFDPVNLISLQLSSLIIFMITEDPIDPYRQIIDQTLTNLYLDNINFHDEILSPESQKGPSPRVAFHIQSIPSCENPYISLANEDLGPFVYSESSDEDKDLPILGPYQFFEDNTIYYGQWKQGKKHGRGELYWPDGSKYEGFWRDSFQCGKGRFIGADGDIYEGNFYNNMYDGEGILFFINKGQRESDAMGNMSLEFFNKYTGFWQNNFPHGKGQYEYSDGTKYKGFYQNGRLNGQGEVENTDGSRYVGEFSNGVKEGYGEYTGADGSLYVGHYHKGVRHGFGTLTEPDGSKYTGNWKNGIQHGKGEYMYPDGGQYIGDFKDGKQDGYGEYQWPDGSRYIGGWKDYMCHGKGIYFDYKGREREGEWKEDKVVRWF